jgi:hypothetical protein
MGQKLGDVTSKVMFVLPESIKSITYNFIGVVNHAQISNFMQIRGLVAEIWTKHWAKSLIFGHITATRPWICMKFCVDNF